MELELTLTVLPDHIVGLNKHRLRQEKLLKPFAAGLRCIGFLECETWEQNGSLQTAAPLDPLANKNWIPSFDRI